MSHNEIAANPGTPTEGTIREQLAAYFLSAPPIGELTTEGRAEYIHRLDQLGRLETRELLEAAGAARPLVWGNPAPLLQALFCAAQRLAAGLGQPILLFPAKETAIGMDTLIHPRMLSVGAMALLRTVCLVAPRQPVWVRLQEQKGALSVAVTGGAPLAHRDTLALVKESTRLHGGGLVLCDNTIVFSCGQVEQPPPGVHLYCCPTEQELLQDTLSPVWSVFYAGVYSALASGSGSSSMDSSTRENPSEDSSASSSSESSSSSAKPPTSTSPVAEGTST